MVSKKKQKVEPARNIVSEKKQKVELARNIVSKKKQKVELARNIVSKKKQKDILALFSVSVKNIKTVQTEKTIAMGLSPLSIIRTGLFWRFSNAQSNSKYYGKRDADAFWTGVEHVSRRNGVCKR